MKTNKGIILAFISVLAFIAAFGIASATVQPTMALNQSNDFVSQYSEMNFTILEYENQKTLQYINISIPVGYALSVPNSPGLQIGLWNNTEPVTVVTPSQFSIGSVGSITLSGSVLSVHLSEGDAPLAVNGGDRIHTLRFVPYIWQNPSAEGVKVWNYNMMLAGDPQLYNSFIYSIVRSYTSSINNNFTSSNFFVSCSANTTLNSNNTLNVNVSMINNNNNTQNILIQTSFNGTNYINWSLEMFNNNTNYIDFVAYNNISNSFNWSIAVNNTNTVGCNNYNYINLTINSTNTVVNQCSANSTINIDGGNTSNLFNVSLFHNSSVFLNLFANNSLFTSFFINNSLVVNNTVSCNPQMYLNNTYGFSHYIYNDNNNTFYITNNLPSDICHIPDDLCKQPIVSVNVSNYGGNGAPLNTNTLLLVGGGVLALGGLAYWLMNKKPRLPDKPRKEFRKVEDRKAPPSSEGEDVYVGE